jgi:hypothetical protein
MGDYVVGQGHAGSPGSDGASPYPELRQRPGREPSQTALIFVIFVPFSPGFSPGLNGALKPRAKPWAETLLCPAAEILQGILI